MTAGYSGKPLAAKLDIRPGHRVLLVGAPAGFEGALAPLPEGARVTRRPSRAADVVHLFVTSRADLAARLPAEQERLPEGGALWVSWPKRASGVRTDVTEDVLREVVLPTGWVDVKVCAVDDTWSGLKFLRRKNPSDKPGRPTAAAAEARRAPPVAVPPDLAAALASDEDARRAFEAMPPSHRREHVRHVEEAKRPETRARRIVKTLRAMKGWAASRRGASRGA